MKKAIEKGPNPLSEGEMHFIWSCCRILKVSKKREDRQRRLEGYERWPGEGTDDHKYHQENQDAVSKEAESHRRESPGPAMWTTWTHPPTACSTSKTVPE